MKQITSPGSMHETGCSGLMHWNDPEGWDGEGGRRDGSRWRTLIHPWLIHVNVWQKPLQYCKVICFQLKKKKKYCPGKNTAVGCHFLLQGIFPTQGWNPGLLHCMQILYHLSQNQTLQTEWNKAERWVCCKGFNPQAGKFKTMGAMSSELLTD